MSEWKVLKKWNPFNSAKLLAHVERWSEIMPGNKIPAPVTVTIDPTQRCNLDCKWCNAKECRESGKSLTSKQMHEIVHYLSEWGVKSVCIAGGGEPTLHEGFGDLVADLIAENIRVGVVTNGTNIDENQQMLLWCDWVGVSIDAGHKSTYLKNKGADQFEDVIEQSKRLIDMARGIDRPLSKSGLGNGVFYKFLAAKSNMDDMVSAIVRAKQVGFKGIHFRPAGLPYGQSDGEKYFTFSDIDVEQFNNNIEWGMEHADDENFSVYGVRHKFNDDFTKCHNFEKCRAVFMTCVFMPTMEKNGEGFDVGLCCDRRSDVGRILVMNGSTKDLADRWGSKFHWTLADNIKPHIQCPRCTFAPHNEIFENVIEQDNMTHDFI